MDDRSGPSCPADRPQGSDSATPWRAATWGLLLAVQLVLGAAIGLQRALASFAVVNPRGRLAPIVAAAAAALLAAGVAVLIRRWPAVRTRAAAVSLLAAAMIVPLSAVCLAVLLYE
ncbi:hypothetical protein ACQ856_30180 (plasmid) [Mycolicibacterium psychrotolerans]|uniref:hypothetical protein n=1 Tax=Mycolicibacterium psychrotolerans TaxID=216929 RepID=UPI003D6681F0